jgi:hypothetical protein
LGPHHVAEEFAGAIYLFLAHVGEGQVQGFVQQDLTMAAGRKAIVELDETFGGRTLTPSLLFSEASLDDLKLSALAHR